MTINLEYTDEQGRHVDVDYAVTEVGGELGDVLHVKEIFIDDKEINFADFSWEFRKTVLDRIGKAYKNEIQAGEQARVEQMRDL